MKLRTIFSSVVVLGLAATLASCATSSDTPDLENAPAKVALSPEGQSIKSVIDQHQPEIAACYKTELKRKPKLHGGVSLKWTVTPTGTVEKIHVDRNTTGSTRLAACMQKSLVTWKFAASKDHSSAELVYPWLFEPSTANRP